tara:strand:+ start:2727 stop:3266 length:540 start_codon:yes stop_codon:yes gene_type:complete
MKMIKCFVFIILLVGCNSDDIDENSTFLERFDGVGFREVTSPDDYSEYYYFDDFRMGVGVGYDSRLFEYDVCYKCQFSYKGRTELNCSDSRRWVNVILEHTYDKIVVRAEKFQVYDNDGLVAELELEVISEVTAIDDNTIISKVTPSTTDWNGSTDTDETTWTRIDRKFSEVDCNSWID